MASEPPPAPATTRASSSARLRARSRRPSRCSTVNTRRDPSSAGNEHEASTGSPKLFPWTSRAAGTTLQKPGNSTPISRGLSRREGVTRTVAGMSSEGLTPYFAGRPLETALFFGGLAVWTVVEVRQAFNRRPDATRADRGSALTLRVCVIAANVLAALAAIRLRSAALPDGAVTFGIGLLVTWAGIGLRWLCFGTLGGYFTFSVMTSPNQRDHIRPLPRRSPSQLCGRAPGPVRNRHRCVRELDQPGSRDRRLPGRSCLSHSCRGGRALLDAGPGVHVLRRRPQAPHPIRVVTRTALDWAPLQSADKLRIPRLTNAKHRVRFVRYLIIR